MSGMRRVSKRPTSAFDVLEGRAQWSVERADAYRVMRDFPAQAFDHTVTDPPYNLATHAGKRTQNNQQSSDIDFAPLAVDSRLALDLLRLTDRWVLAFCALEQLGAYSVTAGEQWIRSGIWDRLGGMPQLSGDRPAQAAEGIAIMHRPGKKRWNRGGHAARWAYPQERQATRPEHPTPKPVALMMDLIQCFTEPGDVVLDPFCGSGSTGVACLRLNRRFVGFEKDARYAKLARERLVADERGLSVRDARAGQASIFDILEAP